MGQSESSPVEERSFTEPLPRAGFRVLAVEARSPAANITVFPDPISARAGFRSAQPGQLIVYLDIITSVNGILLDADAMEADVLKHEASNNVGKPILLEVYNIKLNRYRTVQLTPSASWGGDGLLGVQVRWDAALDLDAAVPADAVLHVVGVEAGSPAEAAGLVAERDFILGTVGSNFATVDAFADFLAGCGGGEAAAAAVDVQIYVLRVDTDSVHIATLRVSDEPWGAQHQTGIGFELACGHVHDMPLRGSLGRNAFALRAEAGAPAAASAPAAAPHAHAAPPLELSAPSAASHSSAPHAVHGGAPPAHEAPLQPHQAAATPLPPSAAQPPYAQVPYTQAPFAPPPYAQAQHEQPQPVQPPHAQPPHAQAPVVQPPHAQPQPPPAQSSGAASFPAASALGAVAAAVQQPTAAGSSPLLRPTFPLAATGAPPPIFPLPPSAAGEQAHSAYVTPFGTPTRPAATISSPFQQAALPLPTGLPSAASRFRHPQYAQPVAK